VPGKKKEGLEYVSLHLDSKPKRLLRNKYKRGGEEVPFIGE
jgi:hypothetical protein